MIVVGFRSGADFMSFHSGRHVALVLVHAVVTSSRCAGGWGQDAGKAMCCRSGSGAGKAAGLFMGTLKHIMTNP